jgi:hypothetical protein
MYVFILAGVFCSVLLAALIGRIAVSMGFRYTSEMRSASLSLYWMHPGIFRGEIDSVTKVMKIWLFGKIKVWPTQPKEKKSATLAPRKLPQQPAEGVTSGSDVKPPFADSSAAAKEAAPKPRQLPPEDEKPHPSTAPKAKSPPLRKKISAFIETIKKSGVIRAFFFIHHAPWRSKMIRWMRRWSCFLPRLWRIHNSELHIGLGLEDPALTGKLFGYWTGIKNAIFCKVSDGGTWTFKPYFNEEHCSIEGALSIRSSLLRFIILGALFLATFPYLATWRAWRGSRRL